MKVERGELVYYVCDSCGQRIWGKPWQEKEGEVWKQFHMDEKCLPPPPYEVHQQ